MNPQESTVMVDKDDFARLEEKVDNLASALGKLILFDERQARQGERIGNIETDVQVKYNELLTKYNTLHETVMKCINYGLGVIGTISTLVAVYKTFK